MLASSGTETALALVMILGPLVVLYGRVVKARDKADDSPRGLGVRVIQLIAIFLFMPMIGILTLEGKISGEAAAALLGVAAGYALSGIERPVPKSKSED